MFIEYSRILLFITLSTALLKKVQTLRGGTEAIVGAYTFSAVLKRGDSYFCSGSVISKSHVVTAGSCVFKDRQYKFRRLPLQVVVGSTNYHQVGFSGIVVDVEKYYVPKKFLHTEELVAKIGNIAVLKLKSSLDLRVSNKGGLSKLFLPDTMSLIGRPAIFTGYGWNWAKRKFVPAKEMVTREGTSSGHLRVASARILPLSECQSHSNEELNIYHHLCARIDQRSLGSPEGTCTGDIGGPLVFHGDTLVGILSTYSTQCDETVKPQVYTKVDAYRDFIDSAVKELKSNDLFRVTLTQDYSVAESNDITM